MKKTKPILKTDYVPAWKQTPGYLSKRFAKIKREQKQRVEAELAQRLERIQKIRTIR